MEEAKFVEAVMDNLGEYGDCCDCGCYRRVAVQRAIRAALAELGTTPNTGSPKLPTLVEVQAAAQREMWKGSFDGRSMSIVKATYDYICRQLRASA